MHVSYLGNVSTPALSVSNVYQIPQPTHNLLSVGQLTKLGFSLTFSSTGVVVQDSQTVQIVGTACKVGRLFKLIYLHLQSSCLSAFAVSRQSTSSLALWNSRLGHASISRVKQLVSKGLLGLVSNKSFYCMPCQFSKQTTLLFNNSVSHALSLFDLIHSDVWGPSPITTQGGSHYFVIFVDDFSRYTWIYLFKNHYELYQIYQDFIKMIETQFSKPIKVFRSDNAQEYNAHEFTSILHQFGIVPHSSCADTSQQNGRAKNILRHILDVVHATTIAASNPSQFWEEAALIAVYTINWCLPLFRIKLLIICCLVLLPPMTYLESLDVSVLFFFKIMKETNFSLILVCVVFLGMELVKKVIAVMIPLANVFVFLGMWSFGTQNVLPTTSCSCFPYSLYRSSP